MTLTTVDTTKNDEINAAGTGLSWFDLAMVIIFSSALFIFWGTPLWQAQRSDSHVGRFVVSYLALLPLCALVLWRRSRWTSTRWFSALGLTASAKLIITWALYQFLAVGTSINLKPVLATPNTAISGSTHSPNEPNIVALPSVLTLDKDAYGVAVLTTTAGATIDVVNRDSRMHTVHLRRGEVSISNQPIPPGRTATLHLPAEMYANDNYSLRCDNHSDESIQLNMGSKGLGTP